MPEKPPDEDLERRVASPRKECADLNRPAEILQGSENIYRTFFENSLDALFITKPDGQVLEANAAACEMFGYSEEELIREGRAAIVDPEDDRLLPALAQRERSGKFAGELDFKRKGGTKLPVEVTSVISRNRKGEDQSGIIVRDLSGRKRHEKMLADSEEMFRNIFHNVGDAIFIADMGGRFLEVNDAACRWLGYTREELLRMSSLADIAAPESVRRIPRRLEVLRLGGRLVFESEHRRKDGSVFPVEVNARRVAHEGKPCLLCVARDITERRRGEAEKEKLRKQLQTAQRMEAVGTLAGGIAHDFNNALTGVMGFAEALRSDLQEEGRETSDLDEILRCAERAATMTRQLLTYARRQVIEPVRLDLNRTIRDLGKLASKALGEQVEVETILAEDLPTVWADPGQVEQVVMNLVLNARDAMPDGGRLVIETAKLRLDVRCLDHRPYMETGLYTVLTVSDTGGGMDKDTEERVFEPFFTTKEFDRGTGLGLSVVYGIVKQHNGYIDVRSEPGKGTSFKIYLPAIDEAVDEVVPPHTVSTTEGTETILLAEDDDSIGRIMTRTLADLGYTVLNARDGEEAVEIFRGNGGGIHVAVLDVVMPRKGGKEACEEMWKMKEDLKVIFLSGYPACGIHKSFVLDKGITFLPKPFSPATLVRKIREILDGSPQTGRGARGDSKS